MICVVHLLSMGIPPISHNRSARFPDTLTMQFIRLTSTSGSNYPGHLTQILNTCGLKKGDLFQTCLDWIVGMLNFWGSCQLWSHTIQIQELRSSLLQKLQPMPGRFKEKTCLLSGFNLKHYWSKWLHLLQFSGWRIRNVRITTHLRH